TPGFPLVFRLCAACRFARQTMTIRTILIVALALLFGGSVAVGVLRLRGQPISASVETVPVVVAAIDIPRGQTVSAAMLKTEDWPKGRIPPGACSQVEDLEDRVAYIPLVKGEVILDAKLAPRGAGRGMGALTRPGMRSFTIPTPNIAAGVA